MPSYSWRSLLMVALLALFVASSVARHEHRPDDASFVVDQHHHVDDAQFLPPGLLHIQPNHEELHTLAPLTGESHTETHSVVHVNQPQIHEPGNSIPKVIKRPGTPEDYSYFKLKDVPESHGYVPGSPISNTLLNVTNDATKERSESLNAYYDAPTQDNIPLNPTNDVAPGAIFFPQDPLQTYSSYSEVPASSLSIEKPSEEVQEEEPYKGFLATWWNTGSFQEAAAGQINHSWKSLTAGVGSKAAKKLKGLSKSVGIKVAKKSKKILVKAAPIIKKIIGEKAISSLFQSTGSSAAEDGDDGHQNAVELPTPLSSYGASLVDTKPVEPEVILYSSTGLPQAPQPMYGVPPQVPQPTYGAPPQIPQLFQISAVPEQSYLAPSIETAAPNAILTQTGDVINEHNASQSATYDTPAQIIAPLTPTYDAAPSAIFFPQDPPQTYSTYSEVPASSYPIEKPSEGVLGEEPYNGFLSTWWNTGSLQNALSGQSNHLRKSFPEIVGTKVAKKWKGFTKGVGAKVAKKSKKIVIKAAPIIKTVIGAKAIASLFQGAGINAAEVGDVGVSGVPALVYYQSPSAYYGTPPAELKHVEPEVIQASYSAPTHAPQPTYGALSQTLQPTYGAPTQSPNTLLIPSVPEKSYGVPLPALPQNAPAPVQQPGFFTHIPPQAYHLFHNLGAKEEQ